MHTNSFSFQRFALTFTAAAACLALVTLAAVGTSGSALTDAAPAGTEWVKNVPVFGLTLSFS